MGRYQSYTRMQTKERPWKIHPIWRGIGCMWILLMPIMAYAGATLFVDGNQENEWLDLPANFYQPINFPTIDLPFINFTFSPDTVKLVLADAIFFFIFLVVGFGLLSLAYAILYSAFGPPRYTQFDSAPVPPVRRHPK